MEFVMNCTQFSDGIDGYRAWLINFDCIERIFRSIQGAWRR